MICTACACCPNYNHTPSHLQDTTLITHMPCSVSPSCLSCLLCPSEEKKLKLKSPNFVVSDTRLSVRNLPLSWTERQLKQAFIAAVSEPGGQAGRRGLGFCGRGRGKAGALAPQTSCSSIAHRCHHLNALPAAPLRLLLPLLPLRLLCCR